MFRKLITILVFIVSIVLAFQLSSNEPNTAMVLIVGSVILLLIEMFEDSDQIFEED